MTNAREAMDLFTSVGVDLILSKWDLAYQNPNATLTDVTPALVNLFHPDQATLNVLASLARKDPVPLEELPHSR